MKTSTLLVPGGRPDAGASIIVALFFATAIGLMVASFLGMAHTEYKLSTQAMLSNSSFSLAEGGADEAFWAINDDDWTTWRESGNVAVKKVSGLDLGSNRTGTFSVVVQNYTTDPVIFAEGRVKTPTGIESYRQLKIELSVSSLFSYGMVSKSFLEFSGQVCADSFDSSAGPYDPVFNRSDKATIGSISNAPGAVKLTSEVDIFGYVGTGGAQPTKGSATKVRGEETPPSVNWDTNRVSTDFTADFPEVTVPDFSPGAPNLPSKISNVITIGNPLGGDPVPYNLDNLTLDGDTTLKVIGPVMIYSLNGVTVSGQAKIQIENEGSLELYTPKDVTISGQGVANNTQQPSKFSIYGTNTVENGQTLSISGTGEFSGTAYLPYGKINFSGQMQLFGSTVGNQIMLSGQSCFHFDEDLINSNTGNLETYKMDTWRELVEQSEQFDFESYFNP